MRLDIAEIWDFLDLPMDTKSKPIHFNLVAGKFVLSDLSLKTLKALKSKREYHEEVLNSIFINREILWQPNVYDKVEVCITNLSIFSAFCQEEMEKLTKSKEDSDQFYNQILEHLSNLSQETVNTFNESIQESKDKVKKATEEEASYTNPKTQIPRILGRFRKSAFPAIKVFIGLLPQGDLVKRFALNRMDFAVQVIINQYNLKYSDVIQPYWEVMTEQSPKKQTKPPKAEDDADILAKSEPSDNDLAAEKKETTSPTEEEKQEEQ